MITDKLESMGFVDNEYVLRNGLKIIVDDMQCNKFCLCTGLDEFYDLTISNTFEMEQLLKILGE